MLPFYRIGAAAGIGSGRMALYGGPSAGNRNPECFARECHPADIITRGCTEARASPLR
jgi:hypothetical protein